MKKLFVCLAAMLLCLAAAAQTGAKYGTLSYDALLREMPEYGLLQSRLQSLRAAYQSEVRYNEQVFETMFADYLGGQAGFAPAILEKRQRDLQEALEKSLAFRAEADSLLRAAERDMLAPIRARLDSVVAEVGAERGYEFILNTDAAAFPYIHSSVAEDAMPFVREKLNARKE
ncbi:MAG: OmpH family outer membrane protein [Bacteroidaceae bacterium]|nr:OmpH family outer membrane protein [Bacteroidaceae bacterium]